MLRLNKLLPTLGAKLRESKNSPSFVKFLFSFVFFLTLFFTVHSSVHATVNDTLTTSGNEMTDTTRTTNTQGDGITSPDSSYGIWESTTNLVTNGGAETNITGWTNHGTGVVSRDTSQYKFGGAS